jgi:MFS family permease
LGATLGAMIAGIIADKLGRKRAIVISDVLTIVGPFLSYFTTTNIGILCIARVILGFGMGISMMVS